MPRGFTEPFARRLDAICNIRVREAEEGDAVEPGVALIAPAGLHMTVARVKAGDAALRHQVALSLNPPDMTHRPSADVLFRSVAENYGKRSMGVIMTGMGSDGAHGLKELRDSGGFTIAQDEATSAIFGMPRAALDLDAADIVVPVTSIADEILKRA
jgi:two-component system chemotaxis response regulator CheB